MIYQLTHADTFSTETFCLLLTVLENNRHNFVYIVIKILRFSTTEWSFFTVKNGMLNNKNIHSFFMILCGDTLWNEKNVYRFILSYRTSTLTSRIFWKSNTYVCVRVCLDCYLKLTISHNFHVSKTFEDMPIKSSINH